MNRCIRAGLVGMSVLCAVAATAAKAETKPGPLAYTGTNLAGGEFGSVKPDQPAVYGRSFTYPTTAEFDYFTGKGMNLFRLPFHWEVLQPKARQPLDAVELARLKAVVAAGTDRKAVVLLDPHNYARYYDKVVGGGDVSAADFADFWGRMAAAFKDNRRVWFGLMNEPHDMPNEMWLKDANAAIAAIRKAGAKNLILVPGTSWTGAHSWVGSGNGKTMLGIADPLNNYVIEVHQYVDSDSSGTHPEPVSPTIGSERLRSFTEWCRASHKRAFLGEFGSSASAASQATLGDMLSYMEANADVWTGFAWWAAGPWWGEYMYTIEPKDGKDRPQLLTLLPHLHGTQPAAR